MRPLHATILREEARLGTPNAAGRSASEASIEAAEARLGVSLSKTYLAFAREVGQACWPVEIFGLQALRKDRGFERPDWFLAFATDGSGNDWGWDLRAPDDGEYPVLFWDHEDPPDEVELAVPGCASSFEDWLDEVVTDAIVDDAEDRAASRWNRVAEALLAHRGGVYPYTPDRDDIRAVEVRLGRDLPETYVEFTARYGLTEWPLSIVDAQEIEALTASMHATHQDLRDAVAFGRGRDGSFLALRGGVIVGPAGVLAGDFLDFLEARIDAPAAPEPPAPRAVEPVDVPEALEEERARRLFQACATASAYQASRLPGGGVQVRIQDRDGNRRRRVVDADTWAMVERHLDGRAAKRTGPQTAHAPRSDRSRRR